MNCRTARPLLVPYLDGELSRGNTTFLEDHLEQCPACARALADLDALEIRPPLRLSDEAIADSQASILATLRALPSERVAAPPPRNRPWRVLALAAALFASLAWGGYQWQRAETLALVQRAQEGEIPASWFQPASWKEAAPTDEDGWL